MVDTIKGSRHANMGASTGIDGPHGDRVLFAFDLERRAILLVGGDKSENWTGWYEVNVSIADNRFDEHQAAIEAKRGSTKRAVPRNTRNPKGKGRR